MQRAENNFKNAFQDALQKLIHAGSVTEKLYAFIAWTCILNTHFKDIFLNNPSLWTFPAAVFYNKLSECIEENYNDDINPLLVETFRNQGLKVKALTAYLLRTVKDPNLLSNSDVVKALASIKGKQRHISVLKLRTRDITRVV